MEKRNILQQWKNVYADSSISFGAIHVHAVLHFGVFHIYGV